MHLEPLQNDVPRIRARAVPNVRFGARSCATNACAVVQLSSLEAGTNLETQIRMATSGVALPQGCDHLSASGDT